LGAIFINFEKGTPVIECSITSVPPATPPIAIIIAKSALEESLILPEGLSPLFTGKFWIIGLILYI
jgi:hypothetical protein